MSPGDDQDENLGDELGFLIGRVDPVPQSVTSFALAAFRLRDVDAELAELLFDSELESSEVAGVRSSGSSDRSLSYATSAFSIDLKLTGGRVVLGQLAPPPSAATIVVESVDGSEIASTTSDSSGRFRLEVERHRTIRLRVETADTLLRTAWVSTSW